VAAMRAALERAHDYPDDHCTELRLQLAAMHKVPPEQILVGAGTTSLLHVIAQTLLGLGKKAICSACSFISYPIVTLGAGATLVETPLRNSGYDLDAILAQIDGETRVVFIANPNNPTGTLLDATAVDRFLAKVPARVTVVLDEAYYDYAQHFAAARKVEYSHSLDYIHSDRKVVVLRTFSKAHGLAGLRVGYAIGPSELIAYFARVQDPFAVSSMGQAAALAALDDDAHVRFAVEQSADQAEQLAAAISRLGFRVNPTWANFLCIDVDCEARDWARRIRQEGILVRPLAAWGAPTCIRVTVGTAHQNQVFLSAFQKSKR